MAHKQPKPFSLRARIQSSNDAFRGIGIFLRYTQNAWLHVFFAAVAVYFGVVLAISPVEWALVAFAVASVFVAEAVNTAIEIHVDLTNPEEHPFARDTKDVAAGAVMLAVFFAGIVGISIFVPKMLPLFKALLG